jgi:hypothetical protein
MNHSLLRIAVASALAVVGAAAYAETKSEEAHMLDVCVQQYIADNLADYQGKVTVNKLSGGYQPMVYKTRTQVKVTAVHRASGEHLGTVVCNVAKDGKVTVAAHDAIAAARLDKLVKAPLVARNAE